MIIHDVPAGQVSLRTQAGMDGSKLGGVLISQSYRQQLGCTSWAGVQRTPLAGRARTLPISCSTLSAYPFPRPSQCPRSTGAISAVGCWMPCQWAGPVKPPKHARCRSFSREAAITPAGRALEAVAHSFVRHHRNPLIPTLFSDSLAI